MWNRLGSGIGGDFIGNQSSYSVSLSDDGTTVAVGAPFDSGTGKARIFSLGVRKITNLNSSFISFDIVKF